MGGLRWFKLCLASGACIGLGLIFLLAPFPLSLVAVVLGTVGAYLGWRALQEDLRGT